MTKSSDLRWVCVMLYYVYSIPPHLISRIQNVSTSSIRRWFRLFKEMGRVDPAKTRKRQSRWPAEVLEFVKSYTISHPCFYLDELQQELKDNFPDLRNISVPTICRALKFDLNLSRKVIERRARECAQAEIDEFVARAGKFITNSDQLVFVDETSKDGRAAIRKWGWSSINTPSIVSVPFARGDRVSAIAALNINGFFAWGMTEGTFDRKSFHKVMVENILPRMNPYPAPNSILILDNAKIHMYPELLEAVHSIGALVFFLCPYSPQFNPIEVAFSVLKSKIIREANMAFGHNPKGVLEALFPKCYDKNGCAGIFRKCGYGPTGMIPEVFQLHRDE